VKEGNAPDTSCSHFADAQDKDKQHLKFSCFTEKARTQTCVSYHRTCGTRENRAARYRMAAEKRRKEGNSEWRKERIAGGMDE
jgi:hypothetical protein